MWPTNFNYVRAESVEAAVKLINEHDDAKLIAGGHSLLPAMKLRLATPATLVDISRVAGLNSISASNGHLKIGALATHAAISRSADVQTHAPALAQAAGLIGDQQVRNFGTLGGNIAHADPASDPPTVLVAYGATVHLHGPNGSRDVAAEDFFVDLFTTSLAEGEIVTAVSIPSASGRKSSYAKLLHPASRYAMVGVAVVLEMNGGTIGSARVAVGGACPSARRSPGAEAALAGKAVNDDTLNAAAAAIKADLGDDLMGDIHASGDYRREMAGVFLKRAVHAAVG